MSRIHATTNFRDSDGVDLGKKLITKDYLISVYPSIAQELGKTPELWTWGYANTGALGNGVTTVNKFTPVTTSAGGSNWKQVRAGYLHTAAIKTDGTLWVWGEGGNGRLGNNSATDRSTPVTTFAGGTNWKQVSSGNALTAAIKTDGTLWIWGLANLGRLGNGITTGNRATPVTTFAGGTNWKQVSGGGSHCAAIKTDGTLWTWGNGGNAQLGTNSTTNKSTPVTTFAGGTNWKQVSAGNLHTAALKTDGTLWTWGLGTYGRLGNAVTTNVSTPVTTFAGGTNWKQVSCGYRHTAAIKTDGTLWTWGFGYEGRLGNAVTIGSISTPVTTFAGGTNWKQVSTGRDYTAAIKTDGTLWTWGYAGIGSLGNAVTTNVSTPVTTFAGGTNWKQVSAGGFHTAAIKTDGTLWTWGLGTYGNLGNNSTTNRSTPVTTFAGGSNWKQVSCGGNNSGPGHTAAIKTDGTLWTWGHGTHGKLGNNSATDRSTPVTTFAGGTNWKQVSATGARHTTAIKTDGTLWVWGSGGNGTLGINDASNKSTPVTTFAGGTNWKQVSGGGNHTAAVKSVDFI